MVLAARRGASGSLLLACALLASAVHGQGVAPGERRSPTAPAAKQEPSGDLPPRRRYVVAAIGDSITDARVGGGGYLARLRERCPRSRFDNYGKGADMVNMMRRRFMNEVLPIARRYTHFVVFGGVNDLYSDRTHARITGDLAFMYGAMRERGVRVVGITVAPWGGFRRYDAARGEATRALNDWIRGAATSGTIDRVVDAYGLLSCGDPERMCAEYARRDGLHVSPRGHTVLGDALHREVFSDCL
jgi:lysophospholipase L1-like esterase